MPGLSPAGLGVVKSTAEQMLLPTGLSSRIAVQDALASRSSGAAPKLRVTTSEKGAKGKGKASGGGKGDPPKPTSKWKALGPERKRILEQHKVFSGLFNFRFIVLNERLPCGIAMFSIDTLAVNIPNKLLPL